MLLDEKGMRALATCPSDAKVFAALLPAIVVGIAAACEPFPPSRLDTESDLCRRNPSSSARNAASPSGAVASGGGAPAGGRESAAARSREGPLLRAPPTGCSEPTSEDLGREEDMLPLRERDRGNRGEGAAPDVSTEERPPV